MAVMEDIRHWMSSNWRRISKDVVNMTILTGQRVVQRGAGLVSLYFVVRHLNPVELGYYQFTAVVLATLAFFALPGLDNAIMQSAARGSKNIYRPATIYSLNFSALGSLVLVIGAFVYRPYQPQAFAPLIVAAVFFTPYLALAQWKSVLLGESRFSTLAKVESITALVTHSGLIVATFCDVRSVWVFVLIYLLPTALVNIVVTMFGFHRLKNEAQNAQSDSLIRYGVQSSGPIMVTMVAEQVERLIIFLAIGPAALAIYLAGDRLSELVRSVFQDAAALLAPRFARSSTYTKRIEGAVWLTSFLAGTAILIFALMLAPAVLLFIFGPGYATSIPYAQALLCSVAIGNVGQFQFRFIRSQHDASSFRNITLFTSGVRIASSFVLINLFGAWGAVASLIVHRLVLSVLTSLVIRWRYRTAMA